MKNDWKLFLLLKIIFFGYLSKLNYLSTMKNHYLLVIHCKLIISKFEDLGKKCWFYYQLKTSSYTIFLQFLSTI